MRRTQFRAADGPWERLDPPLATLGAKLRSIPPAGCPLTAIKESYQQAAHSGASKLIRAPSLRQGNHENNQQNTWYMQVYITRTRSQALFEYANQNSVSSSTGRWWNTTTGLSTPWDSSSAAPKLFSARYSNRIDSPSSRPFHPNFPEVSSRTQKDV